MLCPRCGEANVPPTMIVSVLSPIVTRIRGSWEVGKSSLPIYNKVRKEKNVCVVVVVALNWNRALLTGSVQQQ